MNRILQSLIILCALACPAFAAFTVNSTNAYVLGASGGTTGTLTTTGVKLIVIKETSDGGSAGLNLTDSVSGCASPCNTYTKVLQEGEGVFWYKINPTVGTGHAWATTDLYSTLHVITITAPGTISLDGAGVGVYGVVAGGNPFNNGSLTPSTASNIFLVGMTGQPAFVSATIDSSFTLALTSAGGGGSNYGSATAYKISTALSAESPTWTVASSAGPPWGSGMITFKETGAATPAPVRKGIITF